MGGGASGGERGGPVRGWGYAGSGQQVDLAGRLNGEYNGGVGVRVGMVPLHAAGWAYSGREPAEATMWGLAFRQALEPLFAPRPMRTADAPPQLGTTLPPGRVRDRWSRA